MTTNKHPWEFKQKAIRSTTSKEEFEKLVEEASKKNEKSITANPKSYREIKGIPHKLKDGIWVPLTRI